MSASAERPKNRRVKVVGGGYRFTRGGAKSGGSVKAIRRSLRKKAKELRKRGTSGVTAAKALKERVRELIYRPEAR